MSPIYMPAIMFLYTREKLNYVSIVNSGKFHFVNRA